MTDVREGRFADDWPDIPPEDRRCLFCDEPVETGAYWMGGTAGAWFCAPCITSGRLGLVAADAGVSWDSFVIGTKAEYDRGVDHLEDRRLAGAFHAPQPLDDTEWHEWYARYLKSPAWREKRMQALKRADGRCQVCNRADNLDVHHRTYERVGAEQNGDLTVLCRDCHKTFHKTKNRA